MSITAFLDPVCSSNKSSNLRVVLGTRDALHAGVTEETAGKAHSSKLVFHPRRGDFSQAMCKQL